MGECFNLFWIHLDTFGHLDTFEDVWITKRHVRIHLDTFDIWIQNTFKYVWIRFGYVFIFEYIQ